MNQSELILQLQEENAVLKAENKKLSETVEWMHDMIWSLIKRNKSIHA